MDQLIAELYVGTCSLNASCAQRTHATCEHAHGHHKAIDDYRLEDIQLQLASLGEEAELIHYL